MNQLTLAYTVNVAGSSYSTAKAGAALAAVVLYNNTDTDPVLGQLFGLTVASDATAEPVQAVLSASNTSPIVLGVASTAGFTTGDTVTVASVTGNTAANGSFKIAGLTPTGFQLVGSTGNGAYTGGGTVTDVSAMTRTLTLNMTSVPGTPTAPPPFPCNPITATPPILPYPLQATRTLPGYFLTTPGSAVVPTAFSQVPSLSSGQTVQFLAQPGVFYTVLTVVAASITLTAPYTGTFSEDEGAVVMIPAPAAITAIYSTSPLDSNGVSAISLPAGSGAQTVSLSYLDSTGAGPFTVTVPLMGTYPSPITLAGGSINIATITAMSVSTTGAFGNSVGQITLCQLSAAPPIVQANSVFQTLTDQAQSLITRGLAYLPPSYFALAQQEASAPQLAGTFQLPGRLTTGGTSVATSINPANQTPPLLATNVIEFAAQPGVLYTIAAVGAKNITLTTAWTGLNDNSILSSATLVTPSPAAEPTNTQLSTDMGEFVNPGTAVPPPRAPLAPQTMTPSPTFLSGMFGRTLQLALAVPVVPSAILLS